MREILKDMKYTINKEDMLILILNNLPHEYMNLVEMLEQRNGVENKP